MTLTSDWAGLSSGERIAVNSLSGNRYSGTLLGSGHAGIFLRLPGRGVVRLGLERINADTLHVLGSGQPFEPEDEILFRIRGGREQRGRVLEAEADRVVVSAKGPLAISFVDIDPQSCFLLFRASSLRTGDEFALRSRSGREYRGTLVSLAGRFLICVLRGGTGEVRLRVAELDLHSVEVLIPIALSIWGDAP